MQDLFSCHQAIYQGLGGSFDVYTGKVKRAPDFFVKLGLEWFYRLLKQLARIGRQLIFMNFFSHVLIKDYLCEKYRNEKYRNKND